MFKALPNPEKITHIYGGHEGIVDHSSIELKDLGMFTNLTHLVIDDSSVSEADCKLIFSKMVI